MHLSRSIVAAAVTLTVSLACGSDPTGNPPPGGGADTTPAAVAVVSGNNQSGTVGTALGAALVVEVTNAGDDPLSGVQVNWAVTAGGGTLSAGSSTTNAQGRAQVNLTLGANPVAHTVTATVSNTTLSTSFTATATAVDNTPATITLVSGNGQSGYVGDPLPVPMVVRVQNAAAANLENVTILWSVTQGGGGLGAPTTTTNAQGQASNTFTWGGTAGPHTVTAAVESNVGLSVAFNSTANAITGTADVSLVGSQFQPFNARVLSGGTVTWTWNDGGLTHNVTWVAGGFTDSGDKATGTHQVVFPAAGAFDYYCSIHGTPTTGMRGTVTVSN